MKWIVYILTLISLVNLVYSNTHISEINFVDEEFVEIYSNQTLNLTHKLFFDNAGKNNSNNLSLIQNKDSLFYLIVGDNFLSKYNYSLFNCSIYYSGKSELGYRNLKNSGENITLILNKSTNISWIKTQDLFFQENQTLNYIFEDDSYSIVDMSICNFPKVENINPNIDENLNQSNQNNTQENKDEDQTIEKTKPDVDFQIILDKQIFENKIEFKFQTNVSDYIIEYWIEDYESNIVKNKYNTTNTNKKSYTPKQEIQIYKIFANLYYQNYTYQDNKSIFFYYFKETAQEIENSSNNCHFEIDLKSDDFFEEKIKYSFIIPKNDENFTIEYWIEDLDEKIIKDKKNSTNKNTKTYTPETFSNIFNIKANYYSKYCNTNTSKLAFFYKKYEPEILNQSKEEYLNPLIETISYINISNQEELRNSTSNILKYEIYKGDTLKRSVYFYLNGKKISSIELNKFSKIKGQIELKFDRLINELKIEGLDKNVSLIIISNEYNIENIDNLESKTKIENSEFIIYNLSQNLSKISFNVNSTIENLDADCYINFVKTKISQTINLSNSNLQKLELEINDTKLISKNNQNNYTLKLSCKYKKEELKTYNYENLEFIYKIKSNQKTATILENLLNVKKYKFEENYSYDKIAQSPFNTFTIFEINNSEKIIFEKKIEKKESKEVEVIDNFESSNRVLSKNSFFGIFIGTVLLLFVFLIIW